MPQISFESCGGCDRNWPRKETSGRAKGRRGLNWRLPSETSLREGRCKNTVEICVFFTAVDNSTIQKQAANAQIDTILWFSSTIHEKELNSWVLKQNHSKMNKQKKLLPGNLKPSIQLLLFWHRSHLFLNDRITRKYEYFDIEQLKELIFKTAWNTSICGFSKRHRSNQMFLFSTKNDEKARIV